MKFELFNGEKYSLNNCDFTNMKFQKEVLPKGFSFKFFKNQKKYNAYGYFDEDEIFGYFKKLNQNNAEEPVNILLNISKDLDKISIELRTANEIVPLKR